MQCHGDNFSNTDFIRAAGKTLDLRPTVGALNAVDRALDIVGVKLKNTQTCHTDGKGVVINGMIPNGPAALSDLQLDDNIHAINDMPTMDMNAFGAAVNGAQTNILRVRFNRAGRGNMVIDVDLNNIKL